ncbi:ribbon-helix-helix protein, CopG family [Serratia sp. JSRIV001]|uniref:CopG family ribbon-helix-helix protein n=1 Tax=unclassified Serratia (in: enterobacteria) TaxID=2647522 RepID=UPI001CBB6819|nr:MULTISPECIES: ribbon-helix-helix domain-containing protein [unclassified Serratia (in: enterobacteria)]UAN45251.1 ribbon-helix-helix protein, CopG family [Serratia sp. JSRIV001]UAN50725.1 ribbon-helix-helix protein, CopG family [Serratia sp. JSRIV002]UAN56691.1 ribbon-helix-helix protein, CopG family [Serratia sp. JSRIV004]
MGQSPTRVITAHVPAEMVEKFDELAANYDRSRGWIVKQVLAANIEQEENHHQMILRGLADVDESRVVEQTDVLKWINSLNIDTPLPVPQSGQK